MVPEDRKDEVRLVRRAAAAGGGGPGAGVVLDPESAETILHGQGEMHLRAAVERLSGGYGLKLTHASGRRSPTSETIRRRCTSMPG